MAVVNIPPDGRIYSLGRVPGTLHVYNRGPNASMYNLTIVGVNNWQNINISVGHTNSYLANGNATYIQNLNASGTLQCLWFELAEELTPEQADLETIKTMPGVSGHHK